MTRPFISPGSPIWDSDPGPGPLPQSWPVLEQVNLNRQAAGLDPIPDSNQLTEELRLHGFRDCEGTPYYKVGGAAEAAVQP